MHPTERLDFFLLKRLFLLRGVKRFLHSKMLYFKVKNVKKGRKIYVLIPIKTDIQLLLFRKQNVNIICQ